MSKCSFCLGDLWLASFNVTCASFGEKTFFCWSLVLRSLWLNWSDEKLDIRSALWNSPKHFHKLIVPWLNFLFELSNRSMPWIDVKNLVVQLAKYFDYIRLFVSACYYQGLDLFVSLKLAGFPSPLLKSTQMKEVLVAAAIFMLSSQQTSQIGAFTSIILKCHQTAGEIHK